MRRGWMIGWLERSEELEREESEVLKLVSEREDVK